jgi:hypothetical protein
MTTTLNPCFPESFTVTLSGTPVDGAYTVHAADDSTHCMVWKTVENVGTRPMVLNRPGIGSWKININAGGYDVDFFPDSPLPWTSPVGSYTGYGKPTWKAVVS